MMKQLICALLATLTLAGCGRLPEISRELPELPPVPSPTWERTEKEEGEKEGGGGGRRGRGGRQDGRRHSRTHTTF